MREKGKKKKTTEKGNRKKENFIDGRMEGNHGGGGMKMKDEWENPSAKTADMHAQKCNNKQDRL